MAEVLICVWNSVAGRFVASCVSAQIRDLQWPFHASPQHASSIREHFSRLFAIDASLQRIHLRWCRFFGAGFIRRYVIALRRGFGVHAAPLRWIDMQIDNPTHGTPCADFRQRRASAFPAAFFEVERTDVTR